MTATIVQLITRNQIDAQPQVLDGHHRRGPHPRGMMVRMEAESMVRRFVRRLAAKNPLNDSAGRENVWAQVSDILAMVPSLASCPGELDHLAHAVRRIISARSASRLVSTQGELQSCAVDMAATGNVFRLRMHDADGGARVIHVRLEPNGARRIDDHETG